MSKVKSGGVFSWLAGGQMARRGRALRAAAGGTSQVGAPGGAARCEHLEPRQLLAVVTWDGGGDGVNWTNPANWDGDVLPGTADDVVIPEGGSQGMFLSGSASVRSVTAGRQVQVSGSLDVAAVSVFGAGLQLNNWSTLGGLGELRVGGAFEFTTSSRVTGAGALVILPGATGGLRGERIDRDLVVGAGADVTVQFQTSAWWQPPTFAGSSVTVAPTATLRWNSVSLSNPQGFVTVDNAGTLVLLGGGSTQMRIVNQAGGMLQIQFGATLGTLNGPGMVVGVGSASLALSGVGTSAFSADQLSGIGAISVSGAGAANTELDLGGSFAGTLGLSSAGLVLSQPLTVGSLSVSGGRVTGAGDLTITGSASISGDLSGAGRASVLQSGSLSLGSGTWDRAVTVRGSLSAGAGSFTRGLTVLPGATFSAGSVQFGSSNGAMVPVLLAGASQSINSSTVAETAVVTLASGLNWTQSELPLRGTLTVAPGGVLNGVSIRLDGSLEVQVGGRVSTSRLDVHSSLSIEGEMFAGTIDGPGPVTVANGGSLSGSELRGSGSMTVDSGGLLSGFFSSLNRPVFVDGEAQLAGNWSASVVVRSGGLLSLGNVAPSSGASQITVHQGGTLRTGASTSVSAIPLTVEAGGTAELFGPWLSGPIVNAGVVTLAAGSASMSASYRGSGEFRGLGGWVSGTLTLEGGSMVVPAGRSIGLSSATITTAPGRVGELAVEGSLNVFSLIVGSAVTATITGSLTLNQGGVLSVNGPMSFGPASQVSLPTSSRLELNSAQPVTMPGRIDLNGGTLQRQMPLTLTGTLRWQSGELAGTTPLVFGSTLQMPQGTFNSFGQIRGPASVQGIFRWRGGSLVVSESLTVMSGGRFETEVEFQSPSLSGGEVRVLAGGTAKLIGSVSQTRLVIASGGSLLFPSGLGTGPFGGSGGSIVNDGLVIGTTLNQGWNRIENRGQFTVENLQGSIGAFDNQGTVQITAGVSVSVSELINGPAGTFTVGPSGGSLHVSSLNNSGTLLMTPTFGIGGISGSVDSASNSGEWRLSNGSMTVGNINVSPSGRITLSRFAVSSISSNTLTNAGSVTGTESSIQVASVSNLAGGMLETAVSASTFSNQGTATVSGFASSLTNNVGATLTLRGLTAGSFSNSGRLIVRDGSSPLGSGTLASSSVIEVLSGGSMSISGTLAGSMSVLGGSASVSGNQPVAASIVIDNGGSLSLFPSSGSSASVPVPLGIGSSLDLRDGTLVFHRLELLPGASMSWSGVGNKRVAGDLSVRSTAFTWSGGTVLRSGSTDVTIEGRWAISGGGSMTIDPIPPISMLGPAFVTVQGTLVTGPGGATFNLPVSNAGLIDLSGGPLSLLAGGTHASDFTAEAGATTSLTLNGTHVFAFGSDIASGIRTVVQGGVTSFGSVQRLTRFELAGGTLTGGSDVIITGSLAWSGGSMSGRGRTVLEPTATGIIGEAGTKTLSRVLEIQGAAQAGPGTLNLTQGTLRVAPGGEMVFSGQVSLTAGGGASGGRLENAGRIRLAPGSAVQVSPQVALGAAGGTPGVLASGQWLIDGGTLDLGRGITEIAFPATVTLRGSGASLPSLASLTTLGGSLSLEDGADAAVSGDLTLGGAVSLSVGSTLTVGGGFTQTAAGVIRSIAESDAVYGRIVTSGGATVGGRAEVTATGVQPFTRWALVRSLSGSVAGRFVSVSGPAGELLISRPYSTADDLGVVFTSVADIVGIGGDAGADGLLTGDDFNAFVGAFSARSLLADIVGIGGVSGGDGLVSGDDFVAFINAFAAR
ncbi:MAG: hypothetical protein IOD15_02225 [Phycisphaerales bacterium]|nr:hypothetical protein [Phycisphaerales bacterium]